MISNFIICFSDILFCVLFYLLYCVWVLRFYIICISGGGRTGLPNFIAQAEGAQDIEMWYGERAPVHISVAAARRSGPTLAMTLSRCCEVGSVRPMLLAAWRRVSMFAIPFGHLRDRAHSSEECLSPCVRLSGASAQRPGFAFQCYCRRGGIELADPRQLRQLKLRSARTVGIINPFPPVKVASSYFVSVNYIARFCGNSNLDGMIVFDCWKLSSRNYVLESSEFV